MNEPCGDTPAPMLTVEQQQALERLLEVRELLLEIDEPIDKDRCTQLIVELELALAGVRCAGDD